MNCDWFEPVNSTDPSHIEASITKLEFFAGWFANPIYVNGKYPNIMRQKVRDKDLCYYAYTKVSFLLHETKAKILKSLCKLQILEKNF